MEAKNWARWLTFSLSVLRFWVVVIMLAYRTTALLLAIKRQPDLSYCLPHDFSLSCLHVLALLAPLAPLSTPNTSPYFLISLNLVFTMPRKKSPQEFFRRGKEGLRELYRGDRRL
jgi:hypothetical protein